MVSQLLRTRLLQRLRDQYGGVFNESNVMISATHTHSGPGGFFQYLLYNIPSAGFISQTLNALVDGIGRSVERALARVQPARIYLHKGELLDASINRSPTSYERDPPEERAQYRHDTDKQMVLLRFVDRQGRPFAMMNWFAVHGTSMNNTNHLISSDNKGYAALLFEAEQNGAALPGKGEFVAVFAQANEGDSTPNTRGPRCVDTGLPCDPLTSTCGNPPRNEKCIAFGPGKDMFESTKIIAHKQYLKARQLFADTANQRQVRGPLRFAHEYIDMTKQEVPVYKSLMDLTLDHVARGQEQQAGASGRAHNALYGPRQGLEQGAAPPVSRRPPFYPSSSGNYSTCAAALGYSFAAGTIDGPGAFDFQQGHTDSTLYWNMVRNFLRKPSAEQTRCHHPKPILLDTGEMDFPYTWHPRIVPTQLFMVGQVALVGLPGEFTTMAGRRVRRAVRAALQSRPDVDKLALPNASPQTHDAPRPTPADKAFNVVKNTPRPGHVRDKRRADQRDLSQVGYGDEIEVVLSGLSNIYTSYITTIEEYEGQRYEAASTLYGPHTLQAYINQFARLARTLATTPKSRSFELTQNNVYPPDLTKSLFTLKAGVIFDGTPSGKKFGDVLADVDTGRIYKCRELVGVVFVAGNPRNDLKQEESFLYVERFDPDAQTWRPQYSDASWETKFIWERTNTLLGESKATVEWEIPDQCESGVYRIRHLGAHKSLLQTTSQYEGRSSAFRVISDRFVDNAELLHQVELGRLNATLQLALQYEAQMPDKSVAQPKMDRSWCGMLVAGFCSYLGSIFSRG